MSQENLELVRWLIDAFNKRDVEGFVSRCHPDLEWVPALARAEGDSDRASRGRAGARRWGVAGVWAGCHPELGWVPALARAEGDSDRAYRGSEGFRRWIAEIDDIMWDVK